jgi:membrane-associated phospholipid phosphatase
MMRPGAPRWLHEAERVDVAVYAAIAATPTPSLDHSLRALSRAADRSVAWLAGALLLANLRGRSGRRAARRGVAAITLASALVNMALKPVARRHRPDRTAHGVPLARHVAMPRSRSLPSGHAASAFAFTAGVGSVLPREAAALRAVAALVAYSRVHTGVHYPGDVIAGSLVGAACGQLTARAYERAARGSRTGSDG